MVESVIEQQVGNRDLPGAGKSVSIIGVPLSFGQSMAGVDLGPGAMRVAGLTQRIAKLGYEVHDLGDLPIERPRSLPAVGEKLKYLSELHDACERLAAQVEQIVDAGELPLTIGGDHSIAIGSLAGVVKAFRKRDQRVGLIYFDAHADMNTPDTSMKRSGSPDRDQAAMQSRSTLTRLIPAMRRVRERWYAAGSVTARRIWQWKRLPTLAERARWK